MAADKLIRATLFADHPDGDDEDYMLVCKWLEKWADSVRVEDYCTGGWEHVWDVEASEDALKDLPDRFRCSSEWAGFD